MLNFCEEFRTFPMEHLAGEPSTVVCLKEHQCFFECPGRSFCSLRDRAWSWLSHVLRPWELTLPSGREKKGGGMCVCVFCLVFGFDTVAVAGLRRTGSPFGEPVSILWLDWLAFKV